MLQFKSRGNDAPDIVSPDVNQVFKGKIADNPVADRKIKSLRMPGVTDEPRNGGTEH